jgi:hypothetical protein
MSSMTHYIIIVFRATPHQRLVCVAILCITAYLDDVLVRPFLFFASPARSALVPLA